MGAELLNEAVLARTVAEGDEVLAEQRDGLGRMVVQLFGGGKGQPIAARQVAHRGAWTNFGEALVLFLGKHVSLRSNEGLLMMAAL